MLDLGQIRNEIDGIDKQLVELFEQRMKLTKEVAEYKIQTGKKVLDREREKAKIESVTKLVKNKENVHAIDDLFSQIMANSRKGQYQLLEAMGQTLRQPYEAIDEIKKDGVKIVYQGIPGAYTQEAACNFFGEDCDNYDVPTWRDVMEAVKNKEADAFVSAGSSGAILVGGQVIVGRIKGVERPPLAPLIPTEKGVSLLIDCGANVDARPSHLVQFAQMGSIYMEHVVGIKNPRVAIVNIGAEEEKGNALVKETFPLLKACPDINFIGSIEAREIPHGGADVIVCEAFTGNVILKLYEGVGATLIHMVKQGMMATLRSKIGALLVKPALKTTLKAFDASQYGGAPLLGLKGLVVKTHGSSKRTEVRNSIIQCVTFKEQEINEKIKESLTVGNGKTEEMKE